MKLVMFEAGPGVAWRAGLLEAELIYDLGASDILEGLEVARAGNYDRRAVFRRDEVRLGPPTPRPPSFRDFFAFEQHVANARRNRGGEVPAEWYELAVFYFSNPAAFYGPDDDLTYPAFTRALDLECEVACVIGRDGRDIPADRVEDYIAGFMILNDWSARDIQLKEMAVGLGPAKAKDFATSVGPWLVTPDELADRRLEGGRYNLATAWKLNGVEKYRNNLSTQYFSFGQCIERASQNAWLRRGDVIGSGTVGNGCLLEEGPRRERFLQPGDVVTLEIERLGRLETRIIPG